MTPKDIQELTAEIEDREREFHATFGGEVFFEIGFIRVTEAVGEILAVLYGAELADQGLDSIVNGAFRSECEQGWRALLEEEFNGIYSETALGRILHDLTAYSDFGILAAPSSDPDENSRRLERMISCAKRLRDLVPAMQWRVQDEHLLRVINKASARWKLDGGQNLDALELAVLSDRALQTVKNLLATRVIEGNQNL